MPKYEVKWQETRRISCYTWEVEASSPEEAIKFAQDYDADVDENELYTEVIYKGSAMLIEEETMDSDADAKKE
jgi:hypothetical protein